jgi:hypothetical protein
MTHLPFTLLFAALVSAALALLGQRNLRDRLYHAAYVFLSCTATIIGGAWIMHWIHG